MANSASQNPKNKVGRNSGAGPTGVRSLSPTAKERERGVEPIDLDNGRRWPLRVGLGLGLIAAVGGGVATLMARRAERRRALGGRLGRLVNWSRR